MWPSEAVTNGLVGVGPALPNPAQLLGDQESSERQEEEEHCKSLERLAKVERTPWPSTMSRPSTSMSGFGAASGEEAVPFLPGNSFADPNVTSRRGTHTFQCSLLRGAAPR
jgi:hypothetical protein